MCPIFFWNVNFILCPVFCFFHFLSLSLFITALHEYKLENQFCVIEMKFSFAYFFFSSSLVFRQLDLIIIQNIIGLRILFVDLSRDSMHIRWQEPFRKLSNEFYLTNKKKIVWKINDFENELH